MKIEQIFTKRKYEHLHFWDLVYEWEDILSTALDVDLNYEPASFNKILKGVPFVYKIITKGKPSLCFQMGAEVLSGRKVHFQEFVCRGMRSKNIASVIPCIIDFWLTEADLKAFEKAYSHNKVVLVSSKEAYMFLKRHSIKLNIEHWPLSLPDKYSITPITKFEKKYDLAMMGRQSPVLEGFLQKYIQKHPDFVYAYKKKENGHFNYYTNKGEFVGCADEREGYFNVMRGAKCGLYSTPGLDGKKGANGWNQITPRFLELISSGCHIIARYPQNDDTDFWKISDFSPSIETYAQFEKVLDNAIATPVDIKHYSDYLNQHYTSVRAKQLVNIIKDL